MFPSILTHCLVSAHILYEHQMYRDAAPVFEQALAALRDDKSADTQKWRRVATDQAGMSYGIAGDIRRARKIFNEAVEKDPDYPMYYYMLACADAQAKKLKDARVHLRQAFDRKANVIEGEALPQPALDDSFLPFRNDKDFWNFIQSLQ
jgi:tetratricopeptide (TPR) repeat protein